jgi:formate dehydrogenase subunit beta
MKNSWILDTNGDPLGAVRQFLMEIWFPARLNGMVVPVYQAQGTRVLPSWVKSPELLAQADPFAPLMPINSARLALEISQAHPRERLGAVLRSCEVRAFRRMVEQHKLSASQWLVISVDCLASFPEVDFDWRVHKARQGGVAAYRFRDACQMCLEPFAQDADLSVELLGLPVRQLVVVSARDRQLAEELHLDTLTDGPVPESYLARRETTLATVSARRKRALERKVQALSADAPVDLPGLLQHIAGCAPCQKCLDACPVYFGDFVPARQGAAELLEAARVWLEGCVACGMCDEACPRHLPLTAILNQIAHPALATRVAVLP